MLVLFCITLILTHNNFLPILFKVKILVIIVNKKTTKNLTFTTNEKTGS